MPRPFDLTTRERIREPEVSALRTEHMREPCGLVDDVPTTREERFACDFDTELSPRAVCFVETTKIPEPLTVHKEARPDTGHRVGNITLRGRSRFIRTPIRAQLVTLKQGRETCPRWC